MVDLWGDMVRMQLMGSDEEGSTPFENWCGFKFVKFVKFYVVQRQSSIFQVCFQLLSFAPSILFKGGCAMWIIKV